LRRFATDELDRVPDQWRDIHVFRPQVERARLGSRDVKYFLDELKESPPAAFDLLQTFALRVRELVHLENL